MMICKLTLLYLFKDDHFAAFETCLGVLDDVVVFTVTVSTIVVITIAAFFAPASSVFA
jgi:hypothetical protein